jgi:hypothetical protein
MGLIARSIGLDLERVPVLVLLAGRFLTTGSLYGASNPTRDASPQQRRFDGAVRAPDRSRAPGSDMRSHRERNAA